MPQSQQTLQRGQGRMVGTRPIVSVTGLTRALVPLAGGVCWFWRAEGSHAANGAATAHVDAGSEAYRRCSAVLQRWVPNTLCISPEPSPGCFRACGQVGDPSRWQWPPASSQANQSPVPALEPFEGEEPLCGTSSAPESLCSGDG